MVKGYNQWVLVNKKDKMSGVREVYLCRERSCEPLVPLSRFFVGVDI